VDAPLQHEQRARLALDHHRVLEYLDREDLTVHGLAITEGVEARRPNTLLEALRRCHHSPTL
jgi:hypothetical protein